jgi:hypothetical protein
MINIKEVDWKHIPKDIIINSDIEGKAVAFIIDTDVVETIAATDWFIDLMLSVDFFEDGGSDELNNLFYLNLIKDNEIIESLVCEEKLYAILLSGAKIIELNEQYENYLAVYPGWHFINNDFVI